MHGQTAHLREEAKPEMITPSQSWGDSRRPRDRSNVTGEAEQQVLPSQARSGPEWLPTANVSPSHCSERDEGRPGT